MGTMNKVIIAGYLGADPDKTEFKSGSQVVNFSVATHWKRGDNEETDWHRVKAWDKLGDLCFDYLKKGDMVLIEGRLKYEIWEKDGQKRYFTSIVANRVNFLSLKSKNRQRDDSGFSEANVPF